MNTSTKQRYYELSHEHAPLHKCFFAFSETQFEDGRKEAGIGEDEKIYQDSCGLYGTKEGLEAVFTFYKDRRKRIAAECKPQDVYDYEFLNHECELTYDDEEAIQLVIDYFGEERAKTVKRVYTQTIIGKTA